jgi:hypothetical protein
MTPDERARAVELFFKEIGSAEKKMIANIQKIILTDKLSNDELFEVIKQYKFFTDLQSRGLSSAIKKLSIQYDTALRDVVKTATEFKIDLVGVDIDKLVYLSDLDLSTILRRAEMFSEEMRSEIAKTILTNRPKEEIANILLPQIRDKGITFHTSWMNAALNQSFTRFANVGLARVFSDYPETRYLLVHPEDQVTRDRCLLAIKLQQENPEGLTISQINAGALGPEYTFEDQGGFNCRGFWDIRALGKANQKARTRKKIIIPKRPTAKAVPKPDASGFVEARTIEAAQNFALENNIATSKVSYKGIPLDQANRINKRLLELQKEFSNLDPLYNIYTGSFLKKWASANGKTLNLSRKSFFNSRIGKQHFDVTDGYIQRSKENLKFYLKKKAAGDALSFREQRYLTQLEIAIKHKRWNVTPLGKEIESTITHEFGHVLDDQVFGHINMGFRLAKFNTPRLDELRKQISSMYYKYRNDIPNYGSKVSQYGMTKDNEFFAEIFNMYFMEKDALPAELTTILENIFKEMKNK